MTVKVEIFFNTERVDNEDGSITVKLYVMSRSSQIQIDPSSETPRRKVEEKTFTSAAEAGQYIRYIEETLGSDG